MPRKSKIKYFYAMGGVLIVIIVVHIIVPRPMTVAMLDVGQGDCIVIKKDKFVAVIDGGGFPLTEAGSNTGSRILVPYLEYSAVDRVNIAMITHFHSDHAAGIIELMTLMPVDKLIIPAAPDESSLYYQAIELALEKDIEIIKVEQGNNLNYKNLKLTFLNPSLKSAGFDVNSNSIVCRLDYLDFSFLFTGDIYEEVEKILPKEESKTDVIKIAHHASKTSSCAEFLDTVSPRIALVSYSRYNTYGFPNSDVMERILKRDILLYETPSSGAVILSVYKNKIEIKEMVLSRNKPP
jgi:competence protein ComEC